MTKHLSGALHYSYNYEDTLESVFTLKYVLSTGTNKGSFKDDKASYMYFFHAQLDLDLHLSYGKTHDGEKSLKYDHCSYRSPSYCHIHARIHVHTMEKPYVVAVLQVSNHAKDSFTCTYENPKWTEGFCV